MFRPVDSDRDQSYFLFATTQDQVDYLRFPLGHLPKAQVREIAEEMGLTVAKSKIVRTFALFRRANIQTSFPN